MELLNINGTIVAVLLNFLILLWVLNRYLYKPVLSILESRKQHIDTSLATAERKLADAEGLRADLERKLAAARSEAQKVIDDALKTAERIRHELTEGGRAEAATIRSQAIADIARMQEAARQELKEEVVDLALAAAGKILERSLDEDSNRKFAEAVIAQIQRS